MVTLASVPGPTASTAGPRDRSLITGDPRLSWGGCECPIQPALFQSQRPIPAWVLAAPLDGQQTYHFLSPNAPKHPQVAQGTNLLKATIWAMSAPGHRCLSMERPSSLFPRDLQTWPHFPVCSADLPQHCTPAALRILVTVTWGSPDSREDTL